MLNQNKGILASFLAGVFLAAIGAHLMGYVAAIHIPENWISSSGDNALASRVISFVSQFIAYGIFALVVGAILGRFFKNWLLNSLVCYLGSIFYLTVGIAVVYKTEITSPYFLQSYQDIPSILILPICIIFSTWFTAKKL